ncbi:hypothetical protein BDP55DRAFT_746499, partial [Colletotrichum godetiae]
RVVFRGLELQDDKTLREYSVTENATLHLFLELRSYKPAIYFLSPTRLNNVDVQVKLSRHWSFSTIYPLAKGAVGQNNVSWQVSIKPDGTLKDTATDIDCSYLFWEAGALADPSSAVTEAHPLKPQTLSHTLPTTMSCHLTTSCPISTGSLPASPSPRQCEPKWSFNGSPSSSQFAIGVFRSPSTSSRRSTLRKRLN